MCAAVEEVDRDGDGGEAEDEGEYVEDGDDDIGFVNHGIDLGIFVIEREDWNDWNLHYRKDDVIFR